MKPLNPKPTPAAIRLPAENFRFPAAALRLQALPDTHTADKSCSALFSARPGYYCRRRGGSRLPLLFFTLSGLGWFRGENGSVEPARAGDVHLYDSGAFQEYFASDKGAWRFHWVHFEARPAWRSLWMGWHGVPASHGLRRFWVGPRSLRQGVSGLFGRLHRDLRTAGNWGPELAMNTLERIFLLLQRFQPREDGRFPDSRVLKSLQRLADFSLPQPSLKELADGAGLSSSRFSHLFKDAMGQSAAHYALGLRLEEAAQRLRLGSDSAAEIAYQCGFSSAAHFSFLFKRRFGKGPREYRR